MPVMLGRESIYLNDSLKNKVFTWACRINLGKACFRDYVCERIMLDGLVDYCPIYLGAKFTPRKEKVSVGTNPVVLSPSKFVKRGRFDV